MRAEEGRIWVWGGKAAVEFHLPSLTHSSKSRSTILDTDSVKCKIFVEPRTKNSVSS